MGSKVSKLLKTVAPLALSYFAPGLGTAIGAGLGAGASFAPIVGGGLLGAGTGALTGGGLKGALFGGAGGALGGFARAGGLSGIGDSLGLTGKDGLFGESAQGFGPGIDGTPLNGRGSGIAGALSSAGSDLSSALTGSGGGGSSYSGSTIGSLFGGLNSLNATDQARDDLIESQNKSIGALQPYLNSGKAANDKLSGLLGTDGSGVPTADILASDPSYQFQLDEGNKALDRQQSAKGNFFSGGALKSAQDYGQGLANQTVSNYYTRLAQQSGQGLNAAGGAANAYGNTGMAQANSGIAGSNILNQTLAGILSGSGAYGRRRDPYAYGY